MEAGSAAGWGSRPPDSLCGGQEGLVVDPDGRNLGGRDVVLRVSDNGRQARRARGGMHSRVLGQKKASRWRRRRRRVGRFRGRGIALELAEAVGAQPGTLGSPLEGWRDRLVVWLQDGGADVMGRSGVAKCEHGVFRGPWGYRTVAAGSALV